MSKVIHRDIFIKPEEDKAFLMSKLYQNLHGLMRHQNIQFCIVPISFKNHFKTIMNKKGIANGVRIVGDSKYIDIFNCLDSLLDVADDLNFTNIEKTDISAQSEFIMIKKVMNKTSPSQLRRFLNRNPSDTKTQEQYLTHQQAQKENFSQLFHIQYKNYPIFYKIEKSCDEHHFVTRDSFGSGIIPLIDLNFEPN